MHTGKYRNTRLKWNMIFTHKSSNSFLKWSSYSNIILTFKCYIATSTLHMYYLLKYFQLKYCSNAYQFEPKVLVLGRSSGREPKYEENPIYWEPITILTHPTKPSSFVSRLLIFPLTPQVKKKNWDLFLFTLRFDVAQVKFKS